MDKNHLPKLLTIHGFCKHTYSVQARGAYTLSNDLQASGMDVGARDMPETASRLRRSVIEDSADFEDNSDESYGKIVKIDWSVQDKSLANIRFC
jgi:hypothetical protein